MPIDSSFPEDAYVSSPGGMPPDSPFPEDAYVSSPGGMPPDSPFPEDAYVSSPGGMPPDSPFPEDAYVSSPETGPPSYNDPLYLPATPSDYTSGEESEVALAGDSMSDENDQDDLSGMSEGEAGEDEHEVIGGSQSFVGDEEEQAGEDISISGLAVYEPPDSSVEDVAVDPVDDDGDEEDDDDDDDDGDDDDSY
jgi:hypothetical protein